jgi:two-component system, chemotaxis family, sensor kinase CheA
MNEYNAALDTFFQEVDELLSAMEVSLLGLETTPDDEELINCLFRVMHTLKGNAGFFDFDALVAFTHQAETILDQLRKGERDITADLITLLLEVKDHTACLAKHYQTDSSPIPDKLNQHSQKLINRLNGRPADNSTALNNTTHKFTKLDIADSSNIPADNWFISLEFKENALRNGIDPLSFIHYLKSLGDIVDILTLTQTLPAAEHMDPESCYLSFKIAFNSSADKQTIEDVFEFAEDDCNILILPPYSKHEHYLQLLEELSENQVQRLGDMLIQIGVLTEKEVSLALNRQSESKQQDQLFVKPIGEILIENQSVTRPIVDQALKKQETIKQKVAEESTSIRVDSNKLGELIELVGELVIASSAMQLMVDKHGLDEIEEVTFNMSSLINEVRDTALQLRTIHIGETFSRFRRIVRDTSKTLSKSIELKITGGETELDKTIVEKVTDPLTHLIRNALDHGIEPPEVRIKAGKPATGTIHLNARHDSGLIVIQISDDGAGLDADKIAAKAIANHLISADHHLSKQELFNLIFEPGLSTKEQADNLSGRGVGLDVVKRNIEALRGSVRVESILGQGTTITIHLPLTLAIIDGFMIEAAQERYIIPLNMVEECVELDAKEWHINGIQHYLNLRGEVLPYLRLGEFFTNHSNRTEYRRESLVVVRYGQTRAGFVVDALHGEYQTVIKPLGKLFQELKGISGATILGSGNIALILDVQELIQHAHSDNLVNPPLLSALV